jgi:hypothetical protein
MRRKRDEWFAAYQSHLRQAPLATDRNSRTAWASRANWFTYWLRVCETALSYNASRASVTVLDNAGHRAELALTTTETQWLYRQFQIEPLLLAKFCPMFKLEPFMEATR